MVTAVYRTIGLWFVHEVANKRRQGDADADKALLAEEFKLLGNSAYGNSSKLLSGRPGWCIPQTRKRSTNTFALCGLKISKRSAVATRSNAAKTKSL